MRNKIHSDLPAMADPEYRDFALKIVNSSYPLIGIRLPQLRCYAKELLKEDPSPVFEDRFYEEVLLHGICIGMKKIPFVQKIREIDEFLPLIDSWGICDSFI